MPYSRQLIDLTGIIFGRWTVIKRNGSGPRGEPLWLCECSCNKKTVKNVRGVLLRSGVSMSCGCYRIEQFQKYIDEKETLVNEYFEIDENILGAYARTEKETVFYIDKYNFDKIKSYCWWLNDKGYIYTQVDGKTMLLHRFLMGFPDSKVDHIDRNPLNNLENNLRPVTNQENGRNISLSYDNITGFIGVCHSHIVNDIQQWRARINVNGKEYSKSFPTKEEAIIQRLKWEFEYYGIEFAPQRHLFEEYGII